MRIPLPRMMRNWREREFERHLTPPTVRTGLKAWAFFATRPKLYHWMSRWPMRILRWLSGKRRRLSTLPFASGWTRHRDLPAPEGKTFQQLWAERRRQ